MSVLRAHVAPLADLVLAQEMRRFVRDHPGELRLVAHAQQQPGEDHRHAGREHGRVEVGNAHQVDAEIARRGAADLADQALEVAGERGVLDDQVGARDFLLDALHLLPHAALVGVDRAIAGADQRHHRRGQDARAGGAGRRRGGERATGEQQAAAVERGHAPAFSARRTSRPGFIRPSRRSTITAAPFGADIADREGDWRTLNHTTSPVRRLTRLA